MLVVAASGAAAETAPSALARLAACRTVETAEARLACFDRAAAALESAQAAGEVAVVDREQMRQARRSAFGFNVQTPFFFGRGEKAESLDAVTGVIKSVGQFGGKLTVTLADGAVWRQIDQGELLHAPKPGMVVEVRKGAMGGYMMKIDGRQPVIRVHRDD